MPKKKLFRCEIYDDTIVLNNRKLIMDSRIIDYIITSNYIILLTEFSGDYETVYCYSSDFELFWKVQPPDKKFYGQNRLPYTGLSFNGNICVSDNLGRTFTIDDNGTITDMKCIRF